MKGHIRIALDTFGSGRDRALALVAIFKFLKSNAPGALDCDDIIRSALLLGVSSFDLFCHDLLRLETVHRTQIKRSVKNLRIPFDILNLEHSELYQAVDQQVRQDNAHKSFVSPENLSDCLRSLFDKPWDRIKDKMASKYENPKLRLKSIVDLRNRIVHEADVNPNYNGIELWPIYCEDVEVSIKFINELVITISDIASST
jgi:antitoxin component of RelBE/YafQ-DinJ toxin-antitoxin module